MFKLELRPLVLVILIAHYAGAQRGSAAWRTVVPMPDRVEVYLAGDGIEAPTPIDHDPIPYPPDGSAPTDSKGSCVIATIVGSDGVPRQSMVLHGLVHRFDEAAMDVVNRLRFQPGRINGKPVAVEMAVEIPSPSEGRTNFIPRVFPLTVAAVPPMIRRMMKAKYPKEAKKAKLQGTVEVEVTVRDNGETTDLHVKRSLSPETDESAIAAVRQYLFKPASMGGKPFTTPMTIDVNFTPE